MKNILLIFSILIILTTYCCAGEKVTITTNDYAPYTSTKNNGSGFILDIVRKTFKEVGVEVVYEFYPWKRCEFYVEHGKAFATTPYFKTEERIKKYNFSEPIIYSYNRFFYNKEKFPNGYEWNKIEDFKNYEIGGILGYWYIPEFKRAGLSVFYSSKEKMNLMLLIRKRIDFTIIDELTGRKLMNKNFPKEVDKIGVLKKPLSVLKFYLLISRKYPNHEKLTEKFNRGLKIVKEKTIYKKLLNHYSFPDHFAIK